MAALTTRTPLVIQSSKGPELIAALKAAYQTVEHKLTETTTPTSYEVVNDRVLSTTDPDAAVVRKAAQSPRPRYQHHRAVDDAHGVITAVETTPGNVAENHRALALLDQHQTHTGTPVQTVVADHKYGTTENFVACQQRGICTHLGDARAKQKHARSQGLFPESDFAYDPATNTYRCPAGQTMQPRRLHPQKHTWEYWLGKGVCARCTLRAQCTRAKQGRTLHRHEHQVELEPGASTIAQCGRAAGSTAAPTLGGRQFCGCGQQSWLQTGALATAVAGANPGLVDQRHPKHQDSAQAPPGTGIKRCASPSDRVSGWETPAGRPILFICEQRWHQPLS